MRQIDWHGWETWNGDGLLSLGRHANCSNLAGLACHVSRHCGTVSHSVRHMESGMMDGYFGTVGIHQFMDSCSFIRSRRVRSSRPHRFTGPQPLIFRTWSCPSCPPPLSPGRIRFSRHELDLWIPHHTPLSDDLQLPLPKYGTFLVCLGSNE